MRAIQRKLCAAKKIDRGKREKRNGSLSKKFLRQIFGKLEWKKTPLFLALN